MPKLKDMSKRSSLQLLRISKKLGGWGAVSKSKDIK